MPRYALGILPLLLIACGSSGPLAGDPTRTSSPSGVDGGAGSTTPAPPVLGEDAGTGGGASGDCPGSPGSALFANAACICGDVSDLGTLTVHGSFAANGAVHFANTAQIDDTLVAYDTLTTLGTVTVGDDILTTGAASLDGQVTAGKDVSIGGDLTGTAPLSVSGTLSVGGQDQYIGPKTVTASGTYAAPAGPPCPCGAGSIFDVAAAVKAAAASNDNAAHDVDPSTWGSGGTSTVSLPTGRYYATNVSDLGTLAFSIEGNVALFFDGDLTTAGSGTLTFAPGASLDLYVAGAIHSLGSFNLGSAADAANLRIYVGGSSDVDVEQSSLGATSIYGGIYAPTAQLHYAGDTTITGAVFASALTGLGNLTIAGATFSPSDPTCTPVGPVPVPTMPVPK